MLPAPTARLLLREATPEDAGFMLKLLNEPSWRRYIRRHDVDTEAAARQYLQDRVMSGYGDGLGFWIAELRESGEAAGLCGVIRRDYLEEPDLGFAFLERYWGQGYAREASEAVIAYARDVLKLEALLAISSPDNDNSHALLDRLGFVREGAVQANDGETSVIYRLVLDSGAA